MTQWLSSCGHFLQYFAYLKLLFWQPQYSLEGISLLFSAAMKTEAFILVCKIIIYYLKGCVGGITNKGLFSVSMCSQ